MRKEELIRCKKCRRILSKNNENGLCYYHTIIKTKKIKEVKK